MDCLREGLQWKSFIKLPRFILGNLIKIVMESLTLLGTPTLAKRTVWSKKNPNLSIGILKHNFMMVVLFFNHLCSEGFNFIGNGNEIHSI